MSVLFSSRHAFEFKVAVIYALATQIHLTSLRNKTQDCSVLVVCYLLGLLITLIKKM